MSILPIRARNHLSLAALTAALYGIDPGKPGGDRTVFWSPPVRSATSRPSRPVHQRQPQARERARRMGGDAWSVFKAADRARRGLPMGA